MRPISTTPPPPTPPPLPTPLHRTTLPNNLSIVGPSRADFQFLYREIFVDRQYERHGISIQPGASVLDIGANIGLFALHASTLAGPHGRVLAVEPILPIYACMCENLTRNGATGTVTPIQAAVGDENRPSVSMRWYRSAGGWSTLYPDERDTRAAMDAYVANAPESDLNFIGGPLLSRLFQSLPLSFQRFVANRIVSVMLSDYEQVETKLVTIQHLMAEHGLSNVDLLKVDCERAELDVLRGVGGREEWAMIQQVVLEVHASNVNDEMNEVAQVVQLLRHVGGFKTVVTEQDATLRGSPLHHVYAHRNPLL